MKLCYITEIIIKIVKKLEFIFICSLDHKTISVCDKVWGAYNNKWDELYNEEKNIFQNEEALEKIKDKIDGLIELEI